MVLPEKGILKSIMEFLRFLWNYLFPSPPKVTIQNNLIDDEEITEEINLSTQDTGIEPIQANIETTAHLPVTIVTPNSSFDISERQTSEEEIKRNSSEIKIEPIQENNESNNSSIETKAHLPVTIVTPPSQPSPYIYTTQAALKARVDEIIRVSDERMRVSDERMRASDERMRLSDERMRASDERMRLWREEMRLSQHEFQQAIQNLEGRIRRLERDSHYPDLNFYGKTPLDKEEGQERSSKRMRIN